MRGDGEPLVMNCPPICHRELRVLRSSESPPRCYLPTLEVTRLAVNQLNSGKVPERCGIHAKMLRRLSCRPLVLAHSVVFSLDYEDHPYRLEMGRCRFNLEGK